MDARPNIPAWLQVPNATTSAPVKRERYITRSILSIASVLQSFRLDDGSTSRFSASAPVKLLLALGSILLVSLSRNFTFTLVVLALVLVRAALLPAKKLQRLASVVAAATVFSFVLMLPAILLGQQHSAVLIATKVCVSVSIALLVALTTPYNELTAGLRALHVPALFVMTIDLALKNIVRLGKTAQEVLEALRLRSVGKAPDAGAAIGGVGGVVFLKSNEAAQATYDAMVCRGFDGTYVVGQKRMLKAVDAAWVAGFVALLGLFMYLQGVV